MARGDFEEEEEEEREKQWIFTEEQLAKAREAARDQAAQVLRTAATAGAIEGTPGTTRASREAPRPLTMEEGSLLATFYAQKLPELCDLCSAPPDVRWTAVVFFRRFFAVRSPMEYEPLAIMFACVHLACKVEEVHEITLDKLFEAADFGSDDALKSKVLSLELPLLEGIRFVLQVEPKPDAALRMLSDELQHLLTQSPAHNHAAAITGLTEVAWQEVLERAESIVVELSIRTDAILCRPVSILIVAALSASLDMQDGRPQKHLVDEFAGSDTQGFSDTLVTLLEGNLETEAQRSAVRSLMQSVLEHIRQLESECEVTQDSVKDIAKIARRCHRTFERRRELDTERHEAHRKERKRRWHEMKKPARSLLPTPLWQDLMDLNSKKHDTAQAALSAEATDEFVIRRPPDMDDDAEA